MEKAISIPVNARGAWVKIIRNWQLYVMIAPAIILIFIFAYIPMVGVQIAFRDFNPVGGIWGSPWVGLKHFEWFFSIPEAWRLIRNTLTLSGLGIALGFTAPIILALMINEIPSERFKKICPNGNLCAKFYLNGCNGLDHPHHFESKNRGGRVIH